MTTEPDNGEPLSSPAKRGSRLRRFLLGVATAVGVLLLGLGVAGAIGYQNRDSLASRGASRFLDTPVSITGLVIRRNVLHIGEITVYDGQAASPTIVLEGVGLDLAPRPSDGRYFPGLHVDAATFAIDGSDPDDTSFDFLTAFLAGPPSGIDPIPFLPRNTTIEKLRLDGAMSDWSLSLADVGLAFTVDGLDQVRVRIAGDAIMLAGTSTWTGPLSDDTRQGAMTLHLDWEGNRVHLTSMDIRIPEIAHAIGSGSVNWDHDSFRIEGYIDTLELPGPLAAGVLDFVSPEQVRFDFLHMHAVSLSAHVEGNHLQDYLFQGDAAVSELRVGPEEGRYYDGNLAMTGALDTDGGSVTAHLGQGQRLTLDIAEGFPSAPAALTLDGWSREELVDVVPMAYRSYLDVVSDLKAIDTLEATAMQQNGRWEATLDTAVSMPDGQHHWTASFQAHPNGGLWPIRMNGALAFPDGSSPIQLTGELAAEGTFILHADIQDLNTYQLVNWLPPDALSPGYQARLSGTVILGRTDGQIHIDTDIRAAEAIIAELETFVDQPLTVQGGMTLHVDPNRLEGPGLMFAIGDWMDGTVANWTLEPAPLDVRGGLDMALDFYAIPASVLTGVLGEAWLRGPFHYRDGILDTHITAEGLGLSYGPWMPPAETEMGVSADLTVDTAPQTATIRNLNATWNAGTRLTAEPFELDFDHPAFELAFALHTDLTPLVDLALISAVTGGDASGRGTLRYDPEAFQIDGRVNLYADTLVVLDNMAAFVDISGDGRFRHGPKGLDGAGTARADEGAAFGATLRFIQAPWEAADNRIILPDFDAALFGGRITGMGTIEVLGEDRNGTFEARLENIDLGRFTEEYKPPEIRLTGQASGLVRVDWDAHGIQDLHVELEAPDGCTVNRDLIERLFMSQLIQGIDGHRQFRVMREQVLGETENRPFDSMELTLDWVDGRYFGVLALASETLNLTLDLRIDAEAVTEVMRLRQDAQLDDLADIRLQ